MWEDKENQNPAEAEVVAPKATYEELEARLVEANGNITRWKYNSESATTRLSDRNSQVDELEEYLRKNWEDLDEHAEKIADIFGLEMTSTKTFTVTVEVEIEVTATSPAYDWDNFDGSEIEFDVSASIDYRHRNDLDDVTVDSIDVRECEEN